MVKFSDLAKNSPRKKFGHSDEYCRDHSYGGLNYCGFLLCEEQVALSYI